MDATSTPLGGWRPSVKDVAPANCGANNALWSTPVTPASSKCYGAAPGNLKQRAVMVKATVAAVMCGRKTL